VVLANAFDFDIAVRPGWYVLAAGLIVVVIDIVRSHWRAQAGRPAPMPFEQHNVAVRDSAAPKID